jgi:hypothetical protein
MDIYEKAKDTGKMLNPAAVPVDFSKVKVKKTDRWMYQALVEAKPMQKYLDALITQARASMEKMQLESPVPLQVCPG